MFLVNIPYDYTGWIPRYKGDNGDSGDLNCGIKAQKNLDDHWN